MPKRTPHACGSFARKSCMRSRAAVVSWIVMGPASQVRPWRGRVLSRSAGIAFASDHSATHCRATDSAIIADRSRPRRAGYSDREFQGMSDVDGDVRVVDVKHALSGAIAPGSKVRINGWVRTRRDSKAGLSFVSLSDGSCFDPIQVVA